MSCESVSYFLPRPSTKVEADGEDDAPASSADLVRRKPSSVTAVPPSMPTMSRAQKEPNPASKGPQIFTFALQHRPRATRASVPKVRTGCVTCKKRHVKCDETKPACQRCLKWQGACEGYETASSPSASSSPTPSASSRTVVALGPKSRKKGFKMGGLDNAQLTFMMLDRREELVRAKKQVAQPENVVTQINACPNVNSTLFTHQWERTYYDHWLALAGNISGGWFTSDLWVKTIPQLSHQVPSLRYAAMAIGAMANVMVPNTLPRASRMTLSYSNHYNNALTYYGQALRLMRLRTGLTDDITLRDSIVACLMFVCFETLHGNREAAMGHINHGLLIMEQFMARKSVKAPEEEDCEPPTKSPAPLIVEDEVLQIFRRLHFQSWSTGILRAKRTSRLPYKSSAADPDAWRRIQPEQIPDFFPDLAEARRWWDMVQNWVLHFPRTISVALKKLAQDRGMTSVPDMDLCELPGMEELQQTNFDCLARWAAAFEPLYNAARQNKPEDFAGFLQATSLRLQYLAGWMQVRSVCYADYETMYTMTPQFREVCRLSEILLRHQPAPAPGASETFTIEGGPTFPLFLAGTKCRDPEVRAEALRILARYPRRDGFWDSRLISMLSELNQAIEEENGGGTIREQWARLRERDCQFDPRKPECTVSWFARDPETGDYYKKYDVIRWGNVPEYP